MRNVGRQVRAATESFWFLPAVLLAAAVVLAEVVVGLDYAFVGQGIAELPFVNAVGPSGSRDLLAAIGGSMLGVAATSFSITISVIATASSTYGPRLVRNFMANRGNQLVLGTFGATFLYALLVLRTIREETSTSPAFVPHLAVSLAIVLAVLDVAVLIYFIHHIADSIQVPTLAAQVLTDLQRSITDHRREPPHAVAPAPPEPPDLTIAANRHGYVRHIDIDGLLDAAQDIDVVVRIRPRPGDHVIAGDLVMEAWCGRPLRSEIAGRLHRHLAIGRDRTPRQDLRYAILQMTELAVRAMSTGTNDPYTAITAIVELGTGLAEVVDEPDPPTTFWREGRPRVIVTPVGVVEVVDLAFDQIRTYAVSSTEVVIALLDLAHQLVDRTTRADVIDALHRQQATLRRQYEATNPDVTDLNRVIAAGHSDATRRDGD